MQGTVHAYFAPAVKFVGSIPDGTYVIKVKLTAATNPQRTSQLTSKSFTVGNGQPAPFSGDAYSDINPWFAEYFKSLLTAHGITTVFTTPKQLVTALYQLTHDLGDARTTSQVCLALVGSFTFLKGDWCMSNYRVFESAFARSPVFVQRVRVAKGKRPNFGPFPVGKVKAGYYRVRVTIVPTNGKRAASLSSQRFYVNAKHRIVPSKTKAPAKKKK
jgi:hypothetical protein